MKPFAYDRAVNLEDALTRIGADGEVPTMMAGGTDLLTLLKADIASPAALIDIKRIDDLAGGIAFGDEETTIGALTTLTAIERNPGIRERYQALSDAVGLAASPQIRNRATIGGNLLQRPRCWYYRSAHVQCWLNGGDTCYAREGENALHALFDVSPCVAVHPSDPAAALIALGAEVTLRSSTGERRAEAEQLFAPPDHDRRTEHLLARDEIVMAIHLPAIQTQSVYLKAMDRESLGVRAGWRCGVAPYERRRHRFSATGVERRRASSLARAVGGGAAEWPAAGRSTLRRCCRGSAFRNRTARPKRLQNATCQ